MTRSIAMQKRPANDLANSQLAQGATTRSFIKPCFDARSKELVIFLLLRRRPRRRVPFQPSLPLSPPGIKSVLCDGIGETKRDEISRAVLFPVRQTIFVPFYRLELIEESKVVRRGRGEHRKGEAAFQPPRLGCDRRGGWKAA